MNRKIRYGLIILGIIVFLILAPTIVFYVRGLKIDPEKQTYKETGIITAETDPKNAFIFINDKKIDTTPNSLRFIEAGEYKIKLEKEGYLPWEKRLAVKAGKVTWAQNGTSSVTLFLSSPKSTEISSNILDAVTTNSTTYSLSQNSITITNKGNTTESEFIKLPEEALSFSQQNPDNDYLIIQGKNHWLIFDTASKTTTTLKFPFTAGVKFFTTDTGTLFSLDNKKLNKISWRTQTAETLQTNIEAISIKNNQIYTLTNSSIFTQNISDISNPQSKTLISNHQLKIQDPNLFITSQKEIFLLTDKILYKIGQTPEQIASNVQSVIEDTSDQTIIIITQSEVLFYDWENGQIRLITRFTQKPSYAQIDLKTGYAFIAKHGQIEAIELDNRDHQNTYTLYNGENIKSFYLDDQTKTITLQDNSTIKLLKIR